MQLIDHSKIRKWAPKRFNQFAYQPSQGQSGGILVGWAGSMFTGQIVHNLRYAVTVKFSSVHNAESFTLTAVYGPCTGPEREEFINWLGSLEVQDEENWIFMGNFNFYRAPNNRNREGGNINDVLAFNQAISTLGLMEIPLKGRQYTWSNMQEDPLLVQLDWCFTSVNWVLDYPNTLVLPLAKPTSDHVPCNIPIGTSIPQAKNL